MSSGEEPKTIRQAIQLGVENDISKGKFYEDQSSERKLEKIEVKYQREMFQRQYQQHDDNNKNNKQMDGEEMRVAKYINVAVKDIQSLIRGILGDTYEPRNDFSFTQKQKILSYLYLKNKSNMDNPLKYKTAYGGIEEQDMKIFMLENRLNTIEKLKFDNRVVYLNQIAQCQNRIRYNGFLWGIFASSVLWGTFMRKQSMIRKVCLTLTLTHIGGQISSFRSIDRIFDSVYPIFQKDYDQFFIDEENRKKEHVEAGGIKTDAIQILLEENMKSIRKGKKIAVESDDQEYD